MPKKDATGPIGKGPGSGRGLGNCNIAQPGKQNGYLKGQRDRNQKKGKCQRTRGQGFSQSDQ